MLAYRQRPSRRLAMAKLAMVQLDSSCTHSFWKTPVLIVLNTSSVIGQLSLCDFCTVRFQFGLKRFVFRQLNATAQPQTFQL